MADIVTSQQSGEPQPGESQPGESQPGESQPGEPAVYCPMSGAAVAGFVLAILFAALVAIILLLGLSQGNPFFFPKWALAVPAAGALLGFMGQLQVRRSEGTRAGLKLARWAIGLSVTLGLACATFSFVTEMAVTQQANAFLMEDGPDSGFFPRLIKGVADPKALREAFLLTIRPSERTGAKPANELAMQKMFDPIEQKKANINPGKLTQFRTNPIVGQFLLGDPATLKVEPLGVVDWKFENRSYQVTRKYRFTFPNFTIDLPVEVKSSEGGEGEQRKWYVTLPTLTGIDIAKSARSAAIANLDQLAREYLDKRLLDALTEKGEPVGDFEKLDGTDWKLILQPDAPEEKIRAQIAKAFANRVKIDVPKQDFPRAKKSDDRLVFYYNCRIMIPSDGDLPRIILFGNILVRTDEPFDPETSRVSPGWEIYKFNFLRAQREVFPRNQ
ncbi:MAG: hypothetical protein HY040_11980 [Planctomycetes bacterium]|nr:hypothetical protein [Planctomycetota bacterium]